MCTRRRWRPRRRSCRIGSCFGVCVGPITTTALTLEWPEMASTSKDQRRPHFSGREFFRTERTSTAHQFLMKELRIGLGISGKKTSRIGVCRGGQLSREFRLLPRCFLTPSYVSGLFRTTFCPSLVHLSSTCSNSNRPPMN